MKKLALLALVCGMGVLVAQEPQKDQPPTKDAPAKGPFGRGGRGPFGSKGEKGPMGPTSWKSLTEKFDKNKDGSLAKDEVDEKTWSRLGKEDADKDGKVTEKEHADYRKAMMDKAFGKKRGEAPKDAPKKD